jgi:putative PEP-CTERM system integral membrane protein
MRDITSKLRKIITWEGWAYGLFWTWNVIFLAFMLLGFAPRLLPELIRAVQTETVPWAFLAYAIILTAIPITAVIVGFTVLRTSPGKLLLLGYGVEGPLMLMIAIRFFVVREMTLAVALLLTMGSLGIITLLWQILDRHIDQRDTLFAHLRIIGLTLLLLTGLYAALWLVFYAIPFSVFAWGTVGDMIQGIPDFFVQIGQSLRGDNDLPWWAIPFPILGFILFAFTSTLLIAMPIAVPILYTRAWWQGMRVFMARYPWPRAIALSGGVAIVCVALFIPANRQPQHQAFALLENPPANTAEAQALLEQQETIRTGLLNSYLAPQRYFSSVGEVYHVSAMYEDALKMTPKNAAQVQKMYEVVARPILYEPVNPPAEDETNNNRWSRRRWENQALRTEPQQAADLYEAFFDQTINDGEHDAVVHAARSTWSVDQAQQAWQAVDDREILLLNQEINITEHGDWADVELYEVYENQTSNRQEVVYYFSLPESAVVTGVWLGHSAERDERFVYRVSPRGAAQEIYRREVRYNRDPALLEQIGPRQYRLRIFPIEPMALRWDPETNRSIIDEAPPMHMWLTWRVLAQSNAWPMPQLAEKRNVYWHAESVRLINGQPMSVDEDAWLPKIVTANTATNPAIHRVDFPGGETVIAQPATNENVPQLPADVHLALILDRSRSMAAYAEAVETLFSSLNGLVNRGATIDVYLTASEYRGEAPSRVKFTEFDPASLMYYGGQNAAELLIQFDSLQQGEDYDSVLVITDNTGYKLGDEALAVPIPDAPIWMVHLNDNFPLGYDDATLEAIQASGGGVVGSNKEALTRLALSMAGTRADLLDGYVWSTAPSQDDLKVDGPVITHSPDDDFAALTARRLILATMQEQKNDLSQLDVLDRIHAMAMEHSIVTPYSSMIVLVTEQQEKMLDKLETGEDRFQREYEDVGETIPNNNLLVTGVPEPEEWLLLGLAVLMLGWYFYRKHGWSFLQTN